MWLIAHDSAFTRVSRRLGLELNAGLRGLAGRTKKELTWPGKSVRKE
jgi:hypothetical protein